MRRTLVVIPARMGSTRFPGKMLAPLAGKTLIARVCERAALIPDVAGPRVATDDPRILAELAALGVDVVMTAAGHQSGTDRVHEAAAHWPGLVLNLQGDEPLFDIDTVSALVRRMESDETLAMGTAALPLSAGELADPDRVKVLRDPQGFALDFRRRFASMPAGEAEVLRHAGVYLYRAETLARFVAAGPCPREREEGLEQLRAMALGIPIWVEKGSAWGPGVDRPGDLKVVAKLLDGD